MYDYVRLYLIETGMYDMECHFVTQQYDINLKLYKLYVQYLYYVYMIYIVYVLNILEIYTDIK